MLRLCKDDNFIDLILGGRRIASFKIEGIFPSSFSRDAGEIVNTMGDVPVLLVPEEEYQYLLDCEEMLKSLSSLIEENNENNS